MFRLVTASGSLHFLKRILGLRELIAHLFFCAFRLVQFLVRFIELAICRLQFGAERFLIFYRGRDLRPRFLQICFQLVDFLLQLFRRFLDGGIIGRPHARFRSCFHQ